MPMTYCPDDINAQTVLLLRDGDQAFKVGCLTLHEAVIEVKNRRPRELQGKARFSVTGKGYQYSWADLEPHIE